MSPTCSPNRSRFPAIDGDIQVIASDRPLRECRRRAGNAAHDFFQVFTDALKRVEVRAGILMPTGVFMPVESISIRVLIGMVQALVKPGKFDRSVEFIDELFWRHAFSPFFLRFEQNGCFEHIQAGGIGGGFRPARLAENAFHFRKRFYYFVGLLQYFLGFGYGNSRQGRGHIEQIAFPERRHEFRPYMRNSGNSVSAINR
jgi:hypothetical protein